MLNLNECNAPCFACMCIVYVCPYDRRYESPTCYAHGQIVFLSINRFERKKNIGLAIEAMGVLRDKLDAETFAKVHLVIAGGYDKRVAENVEYFDELEALAKVCPHPPCSCSAHVFFVALVSRPMFALSGTTVLGCLFVVGFFFGLLFLFPVLTTVLSCLVRACLGFVWPDQWFAGRGNQRELHSLLHRRREGAPAPVLCRRHVHARPRALWHRAP